MSEQEERNGPEKREPGYRERLRDAFSAAGDLLSTRAEIFGQEAAEKAGHFGRGLAALAAALVMGWLAMLLFAALLVALFTLLFGQLWAGVLATLVLYGAACAAAGILGWKSLTKVRPLEFPVTRAEIARDWQAVSRSLRPEETVPPEREGPPVSLSREPGSGDDVEARFRAGSE